MYNDKNKKGGNMITISNVKNAKKKKEDVFTWQNM